MPGMVWVVACGMPCAPQPASSRLAISPQVAWCSRRIFASIPLQAETREVAAGYVWLKLLHPARAAPDEAGERVGAGAGQQGHGGQADQRQVVLKAAIAQQAVLAM